MIVAWTTYQPQDHARLSLVSQRLRAVMSIPWLPREIARHQYQPFRQSLVCTIDDTTFSKQELLALWTKDQSHKLWKSLVQEATGQSLHVWSVAIALADYIAGNAQKLLRTSPLTGVLKDSDHALPFEGTTGASLSSSHTTSTSIRRHTKSSLRKICRRLRKSHPVMLTQSPTGWQAHVLRDHELHRDQRALVTNLNFALLPLPRTFGGSMTPTSPRSGSFAGSMDGLPLKLVLTSRSGAEYLFRCDALFITAC